MRSTRRRTDDGPSLPAYLGVDLTDRHAKSVRPIDVCGLRAEGATLRAEFWEWTWTPPSDPVDLTELLPELRASRSVMIDGPQGFATPGASVRACERQARAPGRTPDDWPASDRPFAGFVRSSLELFRAFHDADFPISPSNGVGICEVYPGDLWPRFGGRGLPKKSKLEGRLVRKAMLEGLGVTGLSERPTHDQLDAVVGAVLAACVDGLVPGVALATVGEALMVESDGTLREGPMFVPEVREELRIRLDACVRTVLPAPVRMRATDFRVLEGVSRAAEALLDELVAETADGRPTVCTYKEAAHRVLDRDWSQAVLGQLLQIAETTSPRDLPGLGRVRLDTFIVNAKTGEPGVQHWAGASYERENWLRLFADAASLRRAER